MVDKNITNKMERAIGLVLVALAAVVGLQFSVPQSAEYALTIVTGGYGLYLLFAK